MAHSFISYTVPVTISVQAPAPAVAPSSAESSTTSTFQTLKRLVFGAVSKASEAAAAVQSNTPPPSVSATTQTIWVTQPCITTSGETFALWLNVLYLAPLTYLFAKFFVTSYLRRSNAETTKIRGKGARRMSNVTLAEKAGWDAAKATQREVYADPNEETVEETKVKGQAAGKLHGSVSH
jgi:GNS1/SUR4 family